MQCIKKQENEQSRLSYDPPIFFGLDLRFLPPPHTYRIWVQVHLVLKALTRESVSFFLVRCNDNDDPSYSLPRMGEEINNKNDAVAVTYEARELMVTALTLMDFFALFSR